VVAVVVARTGAAAGSDGAGGDVDGDAAVVVVVRSFCRSLPPLERDSLH